MLSRTYSRELSQRQSFEVQSPAMPRSFGGPPSRTGSTCEMADGKKSRFVKLTAIASYVDTGRNIFARSRTMTLLHLSTDAVLGRAPAYHCDRAGRHEHDRIPRPNSASPTNDLIDRF